MSEIAPFFIQIFSKKMLTLSILTDWKNGGPVKYWGIRKNKRKKGKRSKKFVERGSTSSQPATRAIKYHEVHDV